MIGNPIKIINFLSTQKGDKVFEVKEYKEKRSLTQNAYAWILITQLGNVLHKSKEEVYEQMLKRYGQSVIVSLVDSVVSEGDACRFFKYYDVIGTSEVKGKRVKHYKIYKGSSEFDSKEMSIFIDGIIEECEDQSIPTLTKKQIEMMRLK